MAKAKKYYAVRVGRKPGVYETWAECQAQTKGFSGAEFKSFTARSIAEDAVQNGWDNKQGDLNDVTPKTKNDDYIKDSLSVDGACSDNPGKMEYQCVHTETGELVFDSPIYPVGTNNLGEFLALVHALRYLKENNDTTTPIYSDSMSALAWTRNERVKSNLYRDTNTEELWRDVDNAVDWLRNNHYTNPILKWETKTWGENKADFGRK